ncbi:MAG: PilN domain-containing protein [Lysobacter spongiicola]|nr:PilN domain-containing protein [Lysobacter spongiicola]
MARINLLPWRAERRKQRQKEAMVMLGLSALGAVLLSVLIIFFYNAQIDGQNERNAYLTAQIEEVKKQNVEIDELDEKKARLLARKEVIERLQANRSQMVHLFDSLVRTIPDGVVLTSIKQDNETLSLEGRSQSNARVSTYLRNLEGSGWMTRPELSIIEAKGDDKGLPYEFRLTVKLANPNAPIDEDGDGIPDTVPAPAEAVTTPVAVDDEAPAGPADAAAPADAADPAPAVVEDAEAGQEPVAAPAAGAAS